jgi:hypothetical protein
MNLLLQLLTGHKPFHIPPGIGRVVQCPDGDEDNDWAWDETGKFCPKCEKVLPPDDFYVCGDGRLSSYCKACLRKRYAKRA